MQMNKFGLPISSISMPSLSMFFQFKPCSKSFSTTLTHERLFFSTNSCYMRFQMMFRFRGTRKCIMRRLPIFMDSFYMYFKIRYIFGTNTAKWPLVFMHPFSVFFQCFFGSKTSVAHLTNYFIQGSFFRIYITFCAVTMINRLYKFHELLSAGNSQQNMTWIGWEKVKYF